MLLGEYLCQQNILLSRQLRGLLQKRNERLNELVLERLKEQRAGYDQSKAYICLLSFCELLQLFYFVGRYLVGIAQQLDNIGHLFVRKWSY